MDEDDDQDDGEDGDELEPGVERYMLEEKWSNGGWPKYPLFLIILGGWVDATMYNFSDLAAVLKLMTNSVFMAWEIRIHFHFILHICIVPK